MGECKIAFLVQYGTEYKYKYINKNTNIKIKLFLSSLLLLIIIIIKYCIMQATTNSNDNTTVFIKINLLNTYNIRNFTFLRYDDIFFNKPNYIYISAVWLD